MFGTTEAPVLMLTFHEACFPNDWMNPRYFSLDHPELAFMPKYLSQAAKGPLFSRFADKEMRIEVVRKTANPSAVTYCLKTETCESWTRFESIFRLALYILWQQYYPNME